MRLRPSRRDVATLGLGAVLGAAIFATAVSVWGGGGPTAETKHDALPARDAEAVGGPTMCTSPGNYGHEVQPRLPVRVEKFETGDRSLRVESLGPRYALFGSDERGETATVYAAAETPIVDEIGDVIRIEWPMQTTRLASDDPRARDVVGGGTTFGPLVVPDPRPGRRARGDSSVPTGYTRSTSTPPEGWTKTTVEVRLQRPVGSRRFLIVCDASDLEDR